VLKKEYKKEKTVWRDVCCTVWDEGKQIRDSVLMGANMVVVVGV
jgi:hypothetical protein